MLSGKLIHLIETNHKEITDRILREIWRHPDLPYVRALPEADLRHRGRVILEHLGDWLAGKASELAANQEAVGRLRFEQRIPLHESVQALCLIKNNMIEFLEEQGIPRDTVGLYAEEELEHRIGKFFDTLIIHLVRGYEAAWRKADRTAAA